MPKCAPESAVAVINDHGADRLRSGHPWVYAGDVLGWEASPAPDALTAILRDRRGGALGLFDYSPHSKIRFRRLSGNPQEVPDAHFFRNRIRAALEYRKRVVRNSNSYRLIAAEADGLPGLIVDRYGDALTLQTLTWAMNARQGEIVSYLQEVIRPECMVERNEVRVRELEGLPLRQGVLGGEGGNTTAEINGLRLTVNLLEGQKTGGFLDQRENWAAVAQHAQAHGVADWLDVFTYQGGFALHLAKACAARGGRMRAVDSSPAALAAARANAALNEIQGIEWTDANAFDLLRDYDRSGQRFDLIVLDPPAFAKSRQALLAAAGGYKEINLRALKLLRPGSILVSCSCSHHLSESHLLQVIAEAALDARREVTVLERRTQSLDHPILLNVPETYYLKCIVVAVR